MVSFRKCCFFVDLKIAGIAISILQIFLSTYLVKQNLDEVANLPRNSDFYMKWADLIMLTLLALCALIMLYGAIRRNKDFVIPWLLSATTYGVCLALGLLFKSYRILIPELVMSFAEIAIICYLWICIYSMYKMFRTEKWERDEAVKAKNVELVEVAGGTTV